MFGTLKTLSLRLRRNSRPPSPLPLGLQPKEVEALRALVEAPQWPDLQRAWARLFEHRSAHFGNRLPYDDYLFECGVLEGLRAAIDLPDTLLAAKATYDRATERSPAGPNGVSDWINSPWFHSARRAEAVDRTG